MWAIGEGTRNVSPGSTQPVLAESGGSARGSSCGCAERLWDARWCPTCTGSSARRRDPASGSGRRPASRRTAPAYGDVRAGVAAQHHDLGRVSIAAVTRLQHRGVVVLPNRRGTKTIRLSTSSRMNSSSRSRSDGRIGFTTMPASVAAEIDDRGLVPVRQHERHHAARGHPGSMACASAVACVVQRRAVEPTSPSTSTTRSGVSRAARAVRRPAWCAPTARGRSASAARRSSSATLTGSALALDPAHRHRVTESGRRDGC